MLFVAQVLRLNKTFMKGYVHLSKAYLNLNQIKQCQQCIMVALRQCKGQDTTAIKKVMLQMQAKGKQQGKSNKKIIGRNFISLISPCDCLV